MEMGVWGGRSQLGGRKGRSFRLKKDGLMKEFGMLQSVIWFAYIYAAVS